VLILTSAATVADAGTVIVALLGRPVAAEALNAARFVLDLARVGVEHRADR
jgi:hypothetical protein